MIFNIQYKINTIFTLFYYYYYYYYYYSTGVQGSYGLRSAQAEGPGQAHLHGTCSSPPSLVTLIFINLSYNYLFIALHYILC
jgi:hypothetical protein